MKDAEAPWEAADIVIVTDGEAYVESTWQKEWESARDKIGFSTYGIGIGFSGIGNSLKPLCDNVVTLSDLREDQAVLEGLFTQVAS